MNAFEIQSYQNVTIGNYTLAINNSTTSLNVVFESTYFILIFFKKKTIFLNTL